MKRNMSGRALVVLLAVVLLIGCAVGGTVAWLISKPDSITNTFTVGDIKATLTETKKDFHIVPGVNIEKDPVATVEKNSEACYLFVKVAEENWPTFTEADGTTRKVDYKMATGWQKLENGVYYQMVDKKDTDQTFHILADDQVTVSQNLTKADLNQVTTNPTLTFTVYAVQKEKIASPAEAWKLANGQN